MPGAPAAADRCNPDEADTQAFDPAAASLECDRALVRTPSGLSTTTKRALFQANHPKRPEKSCPETPRTVTTTPASSVAGSSDNLCSSPPPTVVGAVCRSPHEKYDTNASLMRPVKQEIESEPEVDDNEQEPAEPAEELTEEPPEEPTKEPTEEPAEEPAEEPTEEPTEDAEAEEEPPAEAWQREIKGIDIREGEID